MKNLPKSTKTQGNFNTAEFELADLKLFFFLNHSLHIELSFFQLQLLLCLTLKKMDITLVQIA